MTMRPCLVCSEPTDGPRCTEHTVDRGPRTHIAWRNDARWKAMSRKLRKLQPWCNTCGSVDALSVDHILPVSEAPELVYAEDNCQVACLTCNGRRGNHFTPDEARAVLKRLQASYDRHPTKTGRERINVALRLTQTGGIPPLTSDFRPGGRQNLIYT